MLTRSHQAFRSLPGYTVRARVAIGNATTVKTVFLSRTVQVGYRAWRRIRE